MSSSWEILPGIDGRIKLFVHAAKAFMRFAYNPKFKWQVKRREGRESRGLLIVGFVGYKRRRVQETIWVSLLKYVQAMAVRYSEAASAYQVKRARSALLGTLAISFRGLRIVDVNEMSFENIADGRRKFSAGVNVSFRK
jgi:hypothetical protein